MPLVTHRPGFALAIATALALGGLGLGTAARAQSDRPMSSAGAPPDGGMPSGVTAPYRLRGQGELIPENGAIPIEAFSEIPLVEVMDPNGAVLAGVIHSVGVSPHGEILAWVPSARLPRGTLTVTLSSPYGSVPARVERVRVVAPFPSGLPTIHMDVSASLVVLPDMMECCLGAPEACFATLRQSHVLVSPGFTSPAPSPFLDQYLFRIKPTADSVDPADGETFMPFVEVEAVRFYRSADEYCLQVDALNIATGAISSYPFVGCTEGLAALVGAYELNVPREDLKYEACPLPPESQAARWCVINPDLCFGEDANACAIRNHVCDGAPAPAIVSALLSGDDLPAQPRHEAERADAKACSAAPAGRSRSGLSVLLLWALALAALTRSRAYRT